jgi:hypothetical protein
MDNQFSQVKTKWVNQGIPVIIGEYTVSKRPNLDLASRLYFLKYLNTSARNNGIKTFFWDTGDAAGVFNRNTGAITDQDTLNAIMQGAIGNQPTPTRTNTPNAFTPTRTNTPNAFTPTRTNTPNSFTPTRTSTPNSFTPTRTNTPAVPTATPTSGGGTGTCSPVSSTVTAPFTWDGAGVFCWQIATIPSYVNNWNNNSVSINGVNYTNVYVAAGSLPAKINNNYYISYNSSVAWGHLEVR